MKGPFVMAVDVGVSNVKAALIDRHANLAFRERRDLDLEKGQTVVARELVEVCRGVLNAANLTTRDVKAVGCAMPGCVHPEDGVVVASATQFWLGVDVRAPLEAAFERPVHIEGDGPEHRHGHQLRIHTERQAITWQRPGRHGGGAHASVRGRQGLLLWAERLLGSPRRGRRAAANFGRCSSTGPSLARATREFGR